MEGETAAAFAVSAAVDQPGPSRTVTVAEEADEIKLESGESGEPGPGTNGIGASGEQETNGSNGVKVEGEGDVEMEEGKGQPINGEAAEAEAEAEGEINGEKETQCETLYLQNLNEKVRLEVMKETLATLFKPYRPLLPVIAHGNIRMRGQAFVSFADCEAAAKAKKDVNEFPLYGKAISISFARSRADSVVSKLDGSDALESHKAQRLEHKKVTRRTNPIRQKARGKLKAGAEEDEPLTKKPRLQVPDEYLPPNNVLFIQNLPDGTTSDDLRDVFGLHPGLLEIRTIPAKRDIAFIEFTDESAAGVAKDALHNFKIDGETKMKVTYAKK